MFSIVGNVLQTVTDCSSKVSFSFKRFAAFFSSFTHGHQTVWPSPLLSAQQTPTCHPIRIGSLSRITDSSINSTKALPSKSEILSDLLLFV